MLKFNGNILNNNPSGNITRNEITGRITNKTVIGNINDVYLSPIISSYSAEATALFARMTVEPSTALKELIDKTITDLKTAGIWDITDKFHKWDLHTEQASLLDWKNSAHDATNIDGALLVAGFGLSTTRYGNYLDLNFIPLTDCLSASLDDLAFSLDDLSMEETLSYNFGASNAAYTASISFRTLEIAALRPWAFINANTWKVWNGAAGANLYYAERNSSDSIRIYKAPSTNTFGYTNSVAMPDLGLVLGGYRAYNNTVARHNISTSTFWLGKSFTEEQRTAWYEIIEYWKSNIKEVTNDVLGDELIVNGDFSSSDGWTFNDGWILVDGVASATDTLTSLTHNAEILEYGKKYRVTYDVVSVSAGGIRDVCSACSGTYSSPRTVIGHYERIIIPCSASTKKLQFYPSSNFTGTIDNVSVREIL